MVLPGAEVGAAPGIGSSDCFDGSKNDLKSRDLHTKITGLFASAQSSESGPIFWWLFNKLSDINSILIMFSEGEILLISA